MKRNILFALSAALLAASCQKNDPIFENLPDIYLFATVMEVGADPTSDDDTQDDTEQDDSVKSPIYFQLDNKESVVVAENVSKVDLEDLEIGERVIVGVSMSKYQGDSYSYVAKLYEVIPVWLGESAVVTTEQESEGLANDMLSYISSDINLTQGYLNLLYGCTSEDIDNAKFYLVDNQYDTPNEEKPKYLNFELRYDSAGGDDSGKSYEGYLSFDMEPYREQFEGMTGIILQIKTQKSGTASVYIDRKNLFPTNGL